MALNDVVSQKSNQWAREAANAAIIAHHRGGYTAVAVHYPNAYPAPVTRVRVTDKDGHTCEVYPEDWALICSGESVYADSEGIVRRCLPNEREV